MRRRAVVRSRGPEERLSLRRRLIGFALTVVGLPLLTWALVATRTPESITSDVLAFQLFIVIVALVGGIWPALLAAALSGLLLDFFFVEPIYTVTIADPLHLLALVIFLVVAALVSIVVDQAARRARSAARATAEAELLVSVAGSVLSGADALQALVSRLREAFGMTSVLLRQDGEIVTVATDPLVADDDDEETTLPLGENADLYLRGRPLQAADRRVLGAFLAQFETALVQRRLTTEAAGARPLAEADRLRAALLAAVGHDLRRPLAAATTAVSSLRTTSGLSDADRAELLSTADESLVALGGLVTDLLDASRIQAGVLGVTMASVSLEDVVSGALDELGLAPGEVALELAPVPPVAADPVLLQRALVNLLANAVRFTPRRRCPSRVDQRSRRSRSTAGDRLRSRYPRSEAGGCLHAVPTPR